MIKTKYSQRKFDMNKKLNFSVLMGTLLFVFSTLVSAEANVSFSKESVRTKAGNTFTLDVLMSGFSTTEGGGLDLSFDSSLLQVNSVTVDGGVWTFVNKDGDIDNAAGTVTGILFSSYQGVTGNARIATVEFKAINKGRTRIKFKESASNPFASNGQNIDVTFTPTKIRIRR